MHAPESQGSDYVRDLQWRSVGVLPAQRWVRQPAPVRWIAGGLSLLLPLLLLLLLVLPWQQAATGAGKVVTWLPENAEQPVEAPVKGRLKQWHVREGERVEAGQLLVTLVDNDAAWLERLTEQRGSAGISVDAASQALDSYRAKLRAAETGRDAAVAEADAKIAELRSKLNGEEVELEVARTQARRIEALGAEGIASPRQVELAKLSERKALATVEARRDQMAQARRARAQKLADGDAKVAAVQADLQGAQSKLQEARQKSLSLEGKVARQEQQAIRAPFAGVVRDLRGGPGGAQVKEGDALLTLVPASDDRAIELWVDGNYLPLVHEGAEVRVLFEGWPALQFVGPPGSHRGTWRGEVAWMDPVADGKGKFRVLVKPHPEGDPWPDANTLRQGIRAKGFVLLGRVPLGVELWRQINGFPPANSIDKGEKPLLPTQKKPRAPVELE